jgi:3-phosphoshikimate 1-carboxyvinyltransferase
MDIKITRPARGGTIRAIASKSQAHRLLIGAALADGPSRVGCAETSDDIDATVRCLDALGAKVKYDGCGVDILPIPRPVPGERVLDCGESGSTLRFMLPVACALGAGATFHMGGRLPSRPLSPLYEELSGHGCALSMAGKSPLYTGGQLTGGRYRIPGNVSSQFISGLLLALPLLEADSLIEVGGAVESRPYVDITLAALKTFGIGVRTNAHSFTVPGNQRFKVSRALAVEGDWSNAAFWLSHGAVGDGSITVAGLDPSSPQGDKAIMTFLERFGARVSVDGGTVTVSRGDLYGIDIDAGDTPDLVPVLAAVAAVSRGRTVISNAGRLRLKESDRLKAITETLSALGADITQTDDGFIIDGRPRLRGGVVSSHGDHRIAMTAAVVSTACLEAVTIKGAEAVGKSYPGFFTDFAALGGAVEEV